MRSIPQSLLPLLFYPDFGPTLPAWHLLAVGEHDAVTLCLLENRGRLHAI